MLAPIRQPTSCDIQVNYCFCDFGRCQTKLNSNHTGHQSGNHHKIRHHMCHWRQADKN
uniref:Uncharacterized protein n=1 Tax=Arundo donax TaxID=35708 RepID=A0A0A9AIS9_ARUDO